MVSPEQLDAINLKRKEAGRAPLTLKDAHQAATVYQSFGGKSDFQSWLLYWAVR